MDSATAFLVISLNSIRQGAEDQIQGLGQMLGDGLSFPVGSVARKTRSTFFTASFSFFMILPFPRIVLYIWGGNCLLHRSRIGCGPDQ